MLDGLIYVSGTIRVTYMEKIQVYLRKEELNALRKAAARSKRSVAALVREAVRKVILMPPSEGPVAIWDGEPKRSSIEHESVYDEPWSDRASQSSSTVGRGSLDGVSVPSNRGSLSGSIFA